MRKKIALLSQPEYFRFIYEDDLGQEFDVKEFVVKFNMKSDQLKELLEFDADYNIFFRGEFFPNEVLEKLRSPKIALSSEPFPRLISGKWEYTLDSIKRYLSFRKIRYKSFDYVFHYDVASLPLFEKDGMRLSGEFVFPVATNTYKPCSDEKQWDFFFIGRSTPHREKYFGYLKHHYNFLHIAHGVYGPDLVNYINKSKICLNVHAEDEISWEPRMQMTLAAGAFVISEKITPNNYLKPGVDFIEAFDDVDFIEKAEYWLNNGKGRKVIIDNAMATIARSFCCQERFREIIDDIDHARCQKFQVLNDGSILIRLIGRILKWVK